MSVAVAARLVRACVCCVGMQRTRWVTPNNVAVSCICSRRARVLVAARVCCEDYKCV